MAKQTKAQFEIAKDHFERLVLTHLDVWGIVLTATWTNRKVTVTLGTGFAPDALANVTIEQATEYIYGMGMGVAAYLDAQFATTKTVLATAAIVTVTTEEGVA
jgi:hypothetical protein